MADQSDVETALVTVISGALYPNGVSAASALGVTIRVFRGWPNAAALDADLAAGNVNVTVFPVDGAMRNTTRWPYEWSSAPATPTLIATISGQSAIFAGEAGPGQLAGLLVGNNTYVHRTETGDTPDLVAALLANAVQPDYIASVQGATVTVPDAPRLLARTVADAASTLQLRRQDQNFRVSAWCPSPALRDAAVSRIDVALSSSRFIALADGTTGWIRWAGSSTEDKRQDAKLYRRDLLYAVDYPTTQLANLPSMLFGDLVLAGKTYSA